MNLSTLPLKFAVCKLPPRSSLPNWIDRSEFWSITKTDEELSVVTTEECVPGDLKCERGWRIIKVSGPLNFGLTGILASILDPLAQANISIFAVSTFDTDYILVKQDKSQEAREKLVVAGFKFP